MYEKGKGVKVNKEKALELYERGFREKSDSQMSEKAWEALLQGSERKAAAY